nr:MAG TPA: hypothetical protein [Caudoviricetes sp.]
MNVYICIVIKRDYNTKTVVMEGDTSVCVTGSSPVFFM